MIGSAVTTLPWAFQKSGLVLGLAISLLSCFMSYYTCMLTVEMVQDDTDFAETLLRYFGKFTKMNNDGLGPFGFYVGLIAPIILIGSAIVVCFIIMAQVIYPNILAIEAWITGTNPVPFYEPSFIRFSSAHCAFVLFVILVVLSSRKDMGIFMRLSSVGVFFIVILILFILVTGLLTLTDTDLSFVLTE